VSTPPPGPSPGELREPPAVAAAAPAGVTGTDRPEKLGWARLLRNGGFRRLVAVRFAAQWGDGMFQAALGGAVLFNPERQADPLAVAAGLAVILVPYSVVGPFAGALLDRWDRRRVLLVANLVRAFLTLAVALVVFAEVTGPPLYLGALAVAGVSRFVLAGLSAALPHVVARRHLVEANVVAATAGAGVAALGGATAIGARALFGAGDTGSALTTAVAAAGSVLAAVLAAGFAARVLGPDGTDEPDRTLVAVAHGLVDGARATARTPTVAASFVALAAHRFSFGVTTLLTLMLFRQVFTSAGPFRTGMAGVGEAVVLAAAGLGTAALLTPWLVRRLGRPRTVRIALLVAAATQLALAALLTLPAVLAAAFLLGAAGQMVKLCADAGVQSEVGDEVRGRVFALYDAVFNVCYVLAIAVAALLAPTDGAAPWLVAATAAVYVLGLLAHDRVLRRARY
jgi:MFS family permease